MSLAACLGPAVDTRCPHGALVPPGGRCGPCGVVWYATRPRRTYDHADRVENDRIKAAWVATYGPVCAGTDPTVDQLTHPPHLTDVWSLTVDHWGSPVALATARRTGSRTGSPKRVICRSLNSQLGALLGAALGEAADAD